MLTSLQSSQDSADMPVATNGPTKHPARPPRQALQKCSSRRRDDMMTSQASLRNIHSAIVLLSTSPKQLGRCRIRLASQAGTLGLDFRSNQKRCQWTWLNSLDSSAARTRSTVLCLEATKPWPQQYRRKKSSRIQKSIAVAARTAVGLLQNSQSTAPLHRSDARCLRI